VNTFSSFPRVSQLLIGTCANVTSNQRIHSFSSNFSCCLSCTRYLSNLGIENTLLVRINLKSSQDVDLLNQKWRSILLSQLLSNSSKDASRICVLISLSVELNSFHLLVLFYQMICVSLKKLLNLHKVVLLG
jgi:hypothetical protein